jgi:hypothetical protein
VFLAGSVLPRDYPWELMTARGQVGHLLRNDQATKDVPVGVLCAALRGLGSRDVGTAGVNGFDQVVAETARYPGAFPGGHGAALNSPQRIADVAAFLTKGDSLSPGTATAPGWFLRAGRFAQVAPFFAATAALAALVAHLLGVDLDGTRLAEICGAAFLLALLKAL